MMSVAAGSVAAWGTAKGGLAGVAVAFVGVIAGAAFVL